VNRNFSKILYKRNWSKSREKKNPY